MGQTQTGSGGCRSYSTSKRAQETEDSEGRERVSEREGDRACGCRRRRVGRGMQRRKIPVGKCNGESVWDGTGWIGRVGMRCLAFCWGAQSVCPGCVLGCAGRPVGECSSREEICGRRKRSTLSSSGQQKQQAVHG